MMSYTEENLRLNVYMEDNYHTSIELYVALQFGFADVLDFSSQKVGNTVFKCLFLLSST